MFQISANISHIFGPWLILLQMLDIQDSTNWIRLSLILPCYGSWPSWLHKVSFFLVMRCSIFPLFHRHKPSNSCRVYPSPISSIVRAYIAQSQAQSSMLPLLHLELHEIHRHFSCLCSSGDSLVRRSLPAANFPEVPHYSTALIKLPHLLTKCEIYI